MGGNSERVPRRCLEMSRNVKKCRRRRIWKSRGQCDSSLAETSPTEGRSSGSSNRLESSTASSTPINLARLDQSIDRNSFWSKQGTAIISDDHYLAEIFDRYCIPTEA